MGSLVIAKVWEIFQIRQVDNLFLGKRIGLADKDMRLRCKEVGGNQVIIKSASPVGRARIFPCRFSSIVKRRPQPRRRSAVKRH